MNLGENSQENTSDEIRRVVREELSRNIVASSSNLYSKTQDLIRSATQDVCAKNTNAGNNLRIHSISVRSPTVTEI